MSRPPTQAVPVILDTDIGGDIDDTWALAMLLKCPELDVKLVVSDTGDTAYRARILAKMLQIAGRTDIPVGVGLPTDPLPATQAAWVADYALADYPGTICPDGVDAIIQTILASPDPVTLICIGPVPNIAEALRREPAIVTKTRFVGMHGSICRQHRGREGAIAEYNVEQDIPAAQVALSADWPVTITPLDTCSIVVLDGADYERVLACDDPLIQAVLDNYRVWLAHYGRPDEFTRRSSVLFDTVAIYLAFADALLEMDDLPVRVTDSGYTVVEPGAKPMRVAVEWRDLETFEYLLVSRLIA